MIERLLRLILKAPWVISVFEENDNLPPRTAGLTSWQMILTGAEEGSEALINEKPVFVVSADDPVLSPDMIGLIGNGPHVIRRRILSTVKRHLIAGAWTIVGMIIVCVTLTGTAQFIAVLLCVIALLVDLFQLAFKRP
jgi:hypothetical protein